MFKALEKLRRAPHRAREKFTAIITVVIVGCITFIWFLFFVVSLLSTDFHKASVATTTPEASLGTLQAPFSE